MENKTIRKVKFFLPWQDQQEEEWLSEMARAGLHLRRLGWATYEFERGEPSDVVYRLDYNDSLKNDQESYLQLFRDAGWEYVGRLNSWQYFRKPSGGEPAEIYTDAESKVQKYRRVMLASAVWLAILAANIMAYNALSHPGIVDALLGAIAAVMGLHFVILMKVYARVQELKQQMH